MEEAQVLSQKCHQYEDDLDVVQKQYVSFPSLFFSLSLSLSSPLSPLASLTD
jgi:hypothetical protein